MKLCQECSCTGGSRAGAGREDRRCSGRRRERPRALTSDEDLEQLGHQQLRVSVNCNDSAVRGGGSSARPARTRPPPPLRYLGSSRLGNGGGEADPRCPAWREEGMSGARAAPAARGSARACSARTFLKPPGGSMGLGPRAGRERAWAGSSSGGKARAGSSSGGKAWAGSSSGEKARAGSISGGAAAMEQFGLEYARLCAAAGAAPQEAVLRRLREPDGARGRLDLAAQSLSLQTCSALGRLLPGAAPFAALALGDCGLSEEGARGLRRRARAEAPSLPSQAGPAGPLSLRRRWGGDLWNLAGEGAWSVTVRVLTPPSVLLPAARAALLLLAVDTRDGPAVRGLRGQHIRVRRACLGTGFFQGRVR